MGYEIQALHSDVRIKRADEVKALKRLQAATRANSWESSLMPANAIAMLRAKKLEAAFALLGWDVERDDAGRIRGLTYEGKVSGNEQQALNLIAPYVRKGSWIEALGEDGDEWRWRFDGEEAVEDWSVGDDESE